MIFNANPYFFVKDYERKINCWNDLSRCVGTRVFNLAEEAASDQFEGPRAPETLNERRPIFFYSSTQLDSVPFAEGTRGE